MPKTDRRLAAVLFALCLSGCFAEGSFTLRLAFPDEEAKASVSQISIWAGDVPNRTCEEFIGGTLEPDELSIRSRLDLDYPSAQPVKLTGVPAGEIIFLASGRNEAGATLLRGCAIAAIKAGTTIDVSIDLQWVCHPNPSGEIPENDTDDDCDGEIDECTDDQACDDGEICTLDLCDGVLCHQTLFPDRFPCPDGDRCTRRDSCAAGTCKGQPKDCAPFSGQCVVGACGAATAACLRSPKPPTTPCDDGLWCTEPDGCVDGACTGTRRGCDDGNPCTRDECNEGENRCEHVLVARPGAEGAAGDPTCANGIDDDCDGRLDGLDPNCIPCGSDSACSDGNPCTADTCVGGICQNTPKPDGSLCEDGLLCTIDDRCFAGVCRAQPFLCAMAPDPCKVVRCVESHRGCVIEARPDGTLCDDGLFCTVAEQCRAGECRGIQNDCDDDNFCTADTCSDLLDGCEHTLVFRPGAEGPPGDFSCFNQLDDDCDGLTDLADGNCNTCTEDSSCEDGNPCTDDRCVGGFCPNALLADGTACADALYCTSAEACQAGVCLGAAPDCSPVDDTCSLGLCNEASDQCESQPVNEGAPCDDSDPCSTVDTCLQGRCKSGPTTKDTDGDLFLDARCPGGNDCDDTDPLANPGAREGPAGDSTCTDGVDNDCDGRSDLAESDCSACVLDSECDDGKFCTDNVCNPDGTCGFPNNTVPCDDGERCTHSDACLGGGCVGIGYSCDDGNVCTRDACNGDGSCSRFNLTAPCDDGNACSTLDRCGNGVCEPGATDKDTDGDRFFDRSCPGGNDCNDADGRLNPGIFEGPAGDAKCADGLDNDCDALTDLAEASCQACTQDADCADGDVCNGLETCVGVDCRAGTPLVCGDGNPCTDDLCDRLTGCTFANNTRPCDDGDACTRDDACTLGSCTGLSYTCDDGNPCTDDSCNGDGTCTRANNTDLCDDTNACTMDDRCSGGICAGSSLDLDGDSYVSNTCGGTDCDDGNPLVNPGITESTAAGNCTDGLDNDCDSVTDAADFGCGLVPATSWAVYSCGPLGSPVYSVVPGENGNLLFGTWCNTEGVIVELDMYGSTVRAFTTVVAGAASGRLIRTNDGGVATFSHTAAGNPIRTIETHVVKYNADGSIGFKKTYYGPLHYSSATAISKLNDGHLAISGGLGDFYPWEDTPWIAKLNISDGSVLWQKSIPFQVNHVSALADGGLVALGSNRLFKMDANGTVAWSKQLQPAGVAATAALEVPPGDLIVLVSSSYPAENLIVRMTSNGEIIWQKEIRPANFSWESIDLSRDGSLLASGQSTFGGWVVEFDPVEPRITWETWFGDSPAGGPLASLSDGSIAVVTGSGVARLTRNGWIDGICGAFTRVTHQLQDAGFSVMDLPMTATNAGISVRNLQGTVGALTMPITFVCPQ